MAIESLIMPTFTFFDLASAVRQIRNLHFHEASQDFVDTPVGFRSTSRTARVWEITTATGRVFSWSEDNTSTPIISEVTTSKVRVPSRFNYFDLVAAVRSMRMMKFTTGGVITLAVPQELSNHSRNSTAYDVVTTNGTFRWNDDNTSGDTTISEV